MGLYIFKSKYQPYIKVGHTTHDNPWHRLNGSCGVPKGFNSVRHPNSLLGLVEMIDLDPVVGGLKSALTKRGAFTRRSTRLQ